MLKIDRNTTFGSVEIQRLSIHIFIRLNIEILAFYILNSASLIIDLTLGNLILCM